MTAIPLLQIDAFTSEPFAGNPAAVCLLSEARDERWMQNVAMEMNLSEAAFLVARGAGEYDLRWFTPAAEVALCGHATLASAHALFETGAVAAGTTIRFHTASGILTAEKSGGVIELDFPAKLEKPADAPAGLLEALGIVPSYIGRNEFDFILELDDEASVRAVKPDFPKVSAVEARGVIVTARSATGGVDFVSRFFAPAVGVNEDPVTGSAHCCLAPYWAKKLGRNEMTGFQASARGGVVRVRLDGGRVKLGGSAVTIFRGELLV